MNDSEHARSAAQEAGQMTSAIRCENLVVVAGSSRLLDGVSLEVEPGRIVAVVGANGAGKTTLLDAIAGTVPVAGGRVEAGRARANGRPSIGRVFQGSPLPQTLTVAEVAGLATGGREPALALLERYGLLAHASSFVSELSTGMRRILDLAVATASGPPLLLLDEPSSGLAPSEVDELARLLLKWREETGAAILLVEHDALLVTKVADEVLVLVAGQIVSRGHPDEVLHARSVARPRLRHPQEGGFREALAKVAAGAAPAPPPIRRVLSTWTLLRLGLREFAAGLSSVLILGVLNRVMKVELGISLALVAVVLSSYNLAAPFAFAVGHRSDTRPIRGRRRTPYILGGAAITGIAVALAPYAGRALAGGASPLAITAALVLFVAMGLGMYGAGTVFFALLADLAPERERGHAASVVYLELMAGILAGVALTGSVLDERAGGLNTLFALAGILVVAFTAIAVWGQEKRVDPAAAAETGEPPVRLVDALRGIAAIPQARMFFVFMIASTVFLFLQQAVLEPYGGDVLGLDVRQTSAFNALQTIGILAGMGIAGRALADRAGHKRVLAFALAAGAVSFAWLAAAAAAGSAPASWLAILSVGLSTGLTNVAGLALMMGMADAKRTALFMATWTVAHAIADGLATAGGGVLYEAARSITGGEAGGYATVFAIEAVGLLASIALLRGIDPARFSAEAGTMQEVAAPDRTRTVEVSPVAKGARR